MRHIVTDIETAPQSDEFLLSVYPGFPDFDPASVKYGNTKDPEKRAAKLAEATATYEEEKLQHWLSFKRGATLKGHTCRICAIGYYDGKEYSTNYGSEAALLDQFWEHYTAARRSNSKIVGHNLLGFDLPIIRQRSFINRVHVPRGVIDKERFWSQTFVDTMQIWSSGVYPQTKISLDTLSKMLGGPGKLGKGEDFHTLLEKDKEAAMAYLRRDLQEGWRVAEAFGVFSD